MAIGMKLHATDSNRVWTVGNLHQENSRDRPSAFLSADGGYSRFMPCDVIQEAGWTLAEDFDPNAPLSPEFA